MWTSKNRGRYERSLLRYPSDLTYEESEMVEPRMERAKPEAIGFMTTREKTTTA